MALDGRTIRNLTLGLTSVLTGVLLVNINKEKVEAENSRNLHSLDEKVNFEHEQTDKINSVDNINKVIVDSSSSTPKNSNDYVADSSLKLIGLQGIRRKE